ncbi:BON domain-containing protein [Rhizobium leguminosarum]|uniref:BON domain-containing protein n=1 Tax=Rhizobium leguminosarum TaxID=384 RepID=UPI001030F7FB|nr:BON domain-containing protein [Rhizobium leguminosarum]TAY88998.1 BON domain-containing protein [Rhizobium leguminosarum]TAY99826.1 BON domain-containing protein [Rhizobium leguminosarum]TAZ10695.1 BON domain-containing protein [Rhizobium leguminosarum]
MDGTSYPAGPTGFGIPQDIIDELAFEPSIDAAHIGVSVEDGIATLSGHVSTYAEKLTAEDVAARVKGVRAVAVEIEVRCVGHRQHADDQIASRAIDIIAWNTALPEGPVHVKVESGWVTLSGELRWQFQRAAAERAVRKLGGVVGVLNLLTIRPCPTVPDVRRRIEDALKRSAEVDAGGISVKVQDDKVVLEGGVRAWHERSVAERTAWSVPGVATVENHICIN